VGMGREVAEWQSGEVAQTESTALVFDRLREWVS
jgi:hypothetical protein